MKLLMISAGTLLIAGMLWVTLWFWGQGLTYQPYDHNLTNWKQDSGNPVLALSTEDFKEAEAFLKENPGSILQINLHISKDGQFFTAGAQEFEFIAKLPQEDVQAYRGNKHFYYDFDFIKAKANQITTLDTWISLQPRFWIFNIEDNALDVDKNLIAVLEKNNLTNKVVIASDTDLILSSLKEQRPLWVYGSSLSDLTKLLTMASVNLESLVNFKRDYFFTPVSLKNRQVLNSQVIAEVKRRFKKVAIGPVRTDQDRALALEQQPDVLILSSKASK